MGYLYLKFAYVYSCGAPFDSNVQVLTQMQGWVGLVIAQPRLRKTQGFGFRGVSTLNPKTLNRSSSGRRLFIDSTSSPTLQALAPGRCFGMLS